MKRPRRSRPLEPRGLQLAYWQQLRKVVRFARALVKEKLVPLLPMLLERANPGAYADALPPGKRANHVMEAIKNQMAKANRQERIEKAPRAIAKMVSAFNLRQLEKMGISAKPAGTIKAIAQFTAENVALIRDVSSTYLAQVEAAVHRAMATGQRHESLAAELEARGEVAENRAKIIARDQVLKLNGSLNALRQQAAGVEKFIWRTVEDERVRSAHAEFDGNTYDWSDPPGDGSAAEGTFPGSAINCFPGNTRVTSPSLVSKAYRSWFAGDLSTIITEHGEAISSTPNHPVLTLRGWLAAKLVKVGDYVVHVPNESVYACVKNDEHTDTEIVEYFSALAVLFPVEGADSGARGFHGDAVHKQVDIVDIDRGLRIKGDTQFSEALLKDFLTLAYDPAARLGVLKLGLTRTRLTPNSIVGGCCQFTALALSHMRHANQHSLRAVTWLDTALDQLSAHHEARNIEAFRKALYAPTLSEQFRHLIRQIYAIGRGASMQSTGLDTLSAQQPAEVVGGAPECACHLSDSLSGQQVTRVIKKSVSEFTGHVYNLQTVCGCYNANAIVVHNCRCWADPVLPEEEQ